MQVYQEPNRGELSLTCVTLIFLWNVTDWLSPSSTIETARFSVQLAPLAGSQAGSGVSMGFSSH